MRGKKKTWPPTTDGHRTPKSIHLISGPLSRLEACGLGGGGRHVHGQVPWEDPNKETPKHKKRREPPAWEGRNTKWRPPGRLSTKSLSPMSFRVKLCQELSEARHPRGAAGKATQKRSEGFGRVEEAAMKGSPCRKGNQRGPKGSDNPPIFQTSGKVEGKPWMWIPPK